MSASWWLNPMLCIDTETTGIDPFTDRIVEVAAVCVMPDGEAINGWSQIVNPGVDIPAGASQVHGITNTRAEIEGIAPKDALEAISARIYEHLDTWSITQAPVVMFNVRFDWTLLLTEAERWDVEIPPFTGLLDPMLIDRRFDQYRKGSRKLVDVARHYGVALSDDDAHGGLADATAAGRVMQQLLDRFPVLKDYSLSTLWLRQVKSHELWRAGLEAHLRKKNPDTDIPAGWPIPVRPERRLKAVAS